jgi:arylsulfatase A-like enzyme
VTSPLAPTPARRVIGRGLGAGAIYGAAYGAVEALGAVIIFEWLGAGAGILRIIEGELVSLLVQYVLLGVALGVLVAPAVAATERFLPPRWRGPGINFQFLGLAFIAIAFCWNPDSVLPRRFYVVAAFGAQGLILVGILLARLGGAATRRLPPSWRRPALGAAVVAAIVLVAALRSTGARSRRPGGASGTAGPNVVLIVADTLRRDHLSAYGYSRPTSPHIDRLAAEGALFERAYSTASWTLPAHASLFTGLYVSTHGTDAGQSRLPASHPTMAQILAARGYRTAAFSANPWVTSLGGFDRGFERFDYVGVQTVTGVFFVNLVREGWRARRGLPPPDLGGEAVTDGLVRWIGTVAPAGRPFFAFANYMEAHEPYGSVPEPFFSAFLDAPLAPTVGRQWVRDTPLFLCASCSEGGEPAPGLQCAGNGWRVTPERLRASTALYDAGVLYVDHQIGRVVEALDEAGLRDRTLVIVTSDHGESLGERGQMGHGGLLYNSVLDIPLVVRYPRLFRAGTRVVGPVSLVDVLPAVTAASGALVRTAADARDLAAGESPADRPVLAEYFPIAEHVWKAVGRRLRCDYHRAGRESASLQKEGFKYVWSSSGDHELFDVAADPAEERSVLRDRPEVAARLDAELKAWRTRLRSPRREGLPDVIDPATRKALESLGYVN